MNVYSSDFDYYSKPDPPILFPSIVSLVCSTVRSAIIEVMMGAVPPPQRYKHEREHHGNGGLAMGGEAYQGAAVGNRLTGGEEERWSGASVGRGVPDNPAKCIMWCAIALGALMRGSPVEFVSRHQTGIKGPRTASTTAVAWFLLCFSPLLTFVRSSYYLLYVWFGLVFLGYVSWVGVPPIPAERPIFSFASFG